MPEEVEDVVVVVVGAATFGFGSPSYLCKTISTLLMMRCSNGELVFCEEEEHTWRFNVPINRPSRISRASSLCPMSSKASVASCPPTSSRTSSPPLLMY